MSDIDIALEELIDERVDYQIKRMLTDIDARIELAIETLRTDVSDLIDDRVTAAIDKLRKETLDLIDERLDARMAVNLENIRKSAGVEVSSLQKEMEPQAHRVHAESDDEWATVVEIRRPNLNGDAIEMLRAYVRRAVLAEREECAQTVRNEDSSQAAFERIRSRP